MHYIVFADSHHDAMPYSMEKMYQILCAQASDIRTDIHNYGNMSQWRSFCCAAAFMRLYAQARYVFICDNFLAVSACPKSKKTTVVQLWHACGMLKKFGYDTSEDIPKGYLGAVYRNYDLVTVSAPACVEPMRNAMRLQPGIVQPLGVSRTDHYFDPAWRDNCTRAFYSKYPALEGKKLILWAPTFRGNAGDPYQVGTAEMDRLEEFLGPAYHLIRKVHPHVDGKYHLSNCDIPTEELFPVVDLLISDYSSVACEFLFFRKPYVLFAPDLEQYQQKRGFYVPYSSLSPYIAEDVEQLCALVPAALEDTAPDWTEALRREHLAACDGASTARILKYLGLCQEVYADV